MNVLVATKEGQGARKSDFCWTIEGELVRFAVECDSDRNRIDGGCGCRRSFSGIESSRATTTALVIACPDMTHAEFARQLEASLRKGGWGEHFTDDEIARMAKEEADELLALAAHFASGTVLEKRGKSVQIRRQKVQA